MPTTAPPATPKSSDAPPATEPSEDPAVEESDTGDETSTDEVTKPAAADKDWKSEARRREREARTLRLELDQIKARSMSETERAIAEAKAEGVSEATTRMRAAILRSEVNAAAVGKLADPSLAYKLVDLDDVDVDDDGTPDREAIVAAVDGFLAKHPTLAAQPQGKRPLTAPQGSQGDGSGPPSIDDEIVEAEKAGDWKRAISLKSQKLAAIRPG